LLGLLFFAFEIPVEVGVVVCGFAIGYIFTILSPTPSGIGVMGGVMTLSLTSLGLKLEEAAIVTLAFRAISFWIPFFVGMGTFQVLTRRHRQFPFFFQHRLGIFPAANHLYFAGNLYAHPDG